MMLTQDDILLVGKSGAALNRVYTRAFNLINMLEGLDQLNKPQQIAVLHTINEALWAIENKLAVAPFLGADMLRDLDDIRDVIFNQLDAVRQYVGSKDSATHSTMEVARDHQAKQALVVDLDKAEAGLKALFNMVDERLTPDDIPSEQVIPSSITLEEA